VSDVTVPPEASAKVKLLEVLEARYAGSTTVRVFYGPPPADTSAEHAVWVGGHETDDELVTLQGHRGPQVSSRFTVRLFIDSVTGGDDPRLLSESALTIASEVRDTVRDAFAAGDHPDGPARWQKVARSRSEGPLPADGGGWVETVQVDVEFTARIR
jgi:hypothetical protein